MRAGHSSRLSRIALALCALCIVPVAMLPDAGHAARECARVGDTVSQVQRSCGEPSRVEAWEERRTAPVRLYEGGVVRDFGIRDVIVPIEEWTYNFGPTHFVRILTFEDGILKSSRTGGYGWR